ncbi:HlyD family secretion protein [Shinella zoogloeoides]|uniref:HlyD family secretion protein n=1 Tax=Shinella zoogloeoides TaxID=352475 RepID=UPI001F55F1AD|nr:HlyD family efflux transporter periplasmic adaptor subunit [Shinella zoogloeoides]
MIGIGRLWLVVVLAVLAIAGFYAWQQAGNGALPEGFASGNGRIEAVEIDVSAKSPGRIKDILVDEGDLVKADDILARMDTAELAARRRQAEAQLQRASIGVGTAKTLIVQREAEKTAAAAVVAQREAEHDVAKRTLARSEQLAVSNTVSQQILDNSRAAERSAAAAVAAAGAQLAASEAAINAARAMVVDAQAAVDAARAAIEAIDTEIDDATLRAPRDGRVQYRVAQPGEVVGSGGRVLSLVDLGDVSMTFFLPTAEAGRVAIGTEVRLVLDAAPQYVIPARATFVADVAQFTPKTVETEEERQKLMFRIKAKIAPELLRKYIQQVKTGLPGVAYIRLDPKAEWPAALGTVLQ